MEHQDNANRMRKCYEVWYSKLPMGLISLPPLNFLYCRAPDGCLQYYTGTGGSFKSLTRGDNMRMLQQTFYSICFRREENMCEIDYSVTTAGSFQLGYGVLANAGKAINVSNYLSKI